MTKPIPKGYHSITPYLIVSGAAEALEWYKQALGAPELLRMPGPEGKVMPAEFKVGDSPVMMADEYPDMGYVGPATLGGAAVSLYLYVEDVDAVFKRAVAAGAGERYGVIRLERRVVARNEHGRRITEHRATCNEAGTAARPG